MAKQKDESTASRRSITLGPMAQKTLEELCEWTGQTGNAEVVAALQDRHWLLETVRQGKKILVEDKDGTIREIVYRV
jgi:hypothetical protein